MMYIYDYLINEKARPKLSYMVSELISIKLAVFFISLMHSNSMQMQPPLKLNLLPNESRISSKEYSEIILNKERHVLVDVRPAHHFKIVSLPNSLNIPFSTLESRLPEISSVLKKDEEEQGAVSESSAPLYVVCRRGNDSQRAVQYLHKMGFTSAKDIVGGLESWAQNVDPNFPTY
jgi:adenylyltransferase/sulfurtransferase